MTLVRFLANTQQPIGRARSRLEYCLLCAAAFATVGVGVPFLALRIAPLFTSIGTVLTGSIGR